LRIALEDTSGIKVFELMPPLVDTEFSREIGGSEGMSPEVVAKGLLNGLQNDEYEIHVGQTAEIYQLYLSSPSEALKFMRNRRKRLHLHKN
jgi:uncharacterized oxidoreductase